VSGSTTPAGWYPDPSAPGQERYWDGAAWTDAQRPTGGYPPPPPPVAPPPPPGGGQTFPPPPPGMPVGYGYAPRGVGMPAGPAPPNYLTQAILVTLFCCLPAGIVAIVKASQVNGLWNNGDLAGAQAASRSARQWGLASLLIGLAVIAVYAMVALAADSSDTSF